MKYKKNKMDKEQNEITLDYIKENYNQNWPIKVLLNSKYFDISWLDEFSNDKYDQDFLTLSTNNKFDISWVDRYPEKPWVFSVIHKNDKFDISWVDKYPDKPWDFSKMHLRFKINSSNLEEEYNPNFNILWIFQYVDKPWSIFEIIKNDSFLNKNLTDEMKEELSKMDNYELINYIYVKVDNLLKENMTDENLQELSKLNAAEKRKYIHIKMDIHNLVIYKLYPGLFNQIDEPIQLQDLSGNIFYLPDWYQQDNIIEYAKSKLPDLGEFDILIDSQDPEDKKDFKQFLASDTDIKKFKSHLFQNPNGPEGMIIYH